MIAAHLAYGLFLGLLIRAPRRTVLDEGGPDESAARVDAPDDLRRR
jgi:hypothetical protein